MSVVLDVPANTPKERAWVRSLFEAAQARHELYYLDGGDDMCKARLREERDEAAGHLLWPRA